MKVSFRFTITSEDVSAVREALKKHSLKGTVRKGRGSGRYNFFVSKPDANLEVVRVIRSLGYEIEYQDTPNNQMVFYKEKS